MRAALRFNAVANRLVIRVTRCKHGGETGDFFFATAYGAGLLVLPAAANNLERAFAVNFFLQSPQRTIHRLAFFQFNLCQCTHFLSGAGGTAPGAVPANIGTENYGFSAREVNCFSWPK